MNSDQYRKTLEKLAVVDWSKPNVPVVTKILATTQQCNDCGRACEGQPVRTLIRSHAAWSERCSLCNLYRSDAGLFELKSRRRVKTANDSGSKPLKKLGRLSQPIEHVTSSCPDDHVAFASPQPIHVTELLVHPCPVSPDPVDHLRLDISIHKC
jgi:hypothetical protein